MAENIKERKKLIEKSLGKYLWETYAFLIILFSLNIFHIVVGIRFYIIKGAYITLGIKNGTLIFLILIPVYFACAFGVYLYRGNEKLIKQYILYDPANAGKPLRDRALSFPVLVELAAFTGLLDLLSTEKWYFFAFGQAIAVAVLLAAVPFRYKWNAVLKSVYSKIEPEELNDKMSDISGDA